MVASIRTPSMIWHQSIPADWTHLSKSDGAEDDLSMGLTDGVEEDESHDSASEVRESCLSELLPSGTRCIILLFLAVKRSPGPHPIHQTAQFGRCTPWFTQKIYFNSLRCSLRLSQHIHSTRQLVRNIIVLFASASVFKIKWNNFVDTLIRNRFFFR